MLNRQKIRTEMDSAGKSTVSWEKLGMDTMEPKIEVNWNQSFNMCAEWSELRYTPTNIGQILLSFEVIISMNAPRPHKVRARLKARKTLEMLKFSNRDIRLERIKCSALSKLQNKNANVDFENRAPNSERRRWLAKRVCGIQLRACIACMCSTSLCNRMRCQLLGGILLFFTVV